MVSVVLSLVCTTDARAQSFLDKYGGPPSTAPPPAPPPPAVKKVKPPPAAPPPVEEPEAAVESEPVAPVEPTPAGAADPEPEAPSVTEAAPVGAADEDSAAEAELLELRATVDALNAQVAALEIERRTETRTAALDHHRGPELEAGLTAASAYAYRGIDVFGASEGGAGLLAPSLSLAAGEFEAGWFASFRAYGAHADALVREGVGYEQNVFGAWSRELPSGLGIEAALTATAFPWADRAVTGAALPLWVEPAVALSADVGIGVALLVSQLQGVSAGTNEDSYSYGQLAVEHAVPVREGADVLLGAAAGAKRWNMGDQGRENTFDVDLSWGLDLHGETVGISPSAHLTWTNVPGASAGAETFTWVGVSSTLGL
ncbi:MAG: hypothetical protein ABMA64_12770 [Myxococcota bacterium]